MGDHVPILKPELQALVEYAASLGASPTTPPPKHEVPHASWTRIMPLMTKVTGDLDDAAVNLAEASESPSASPGTRRRLRTCAERVRNVGFDAGDVHRRARLLLGRSTAERQVFTPEQEAKLELLAAMARRARSQANLHDKVAAIAGAVGRSVDRDAAQSVVHDLLAQVREAQKESTASALEADASRIERARQREAAKSARASGAAAELGDVEGADDEGEPVEADDGRVREDSGTKTLKAAVQRVDVLLDALEKVIERALDDLPDRRKPADAAVGTSHRELAEQSLASCQRSLETVRKHLGDSPGLDDDAQVFSDRLDLLSELVLGVRRTLSEVPSP